MTEPVEAGDVFGELRERFREMAERYPAARCACGGADDAEEFECPNCGRMVCATCAESDGCGICESGRRHPWQRRIIVTKGKEGA